MLPLYRPNISYVNTSGYVAGAGVRLQALTIQALEPDLVVAIGTGAVDAILTAAKPAAQATEASPAEGAAKSAPETAPKAPEPAPPPPAKQ